MAETNGWFKPEAISSTVDITVKASGQPEDFDSAARAQLIKKMADELGVPASTLELTITAAARRRALLGAGSRSRRLSEAAEVILVFTVVVENAMQAKNITDTAAEGLSTAEDAGAILGVTVVATPVTAVTATCAPTPLTLPPPPSAAPSPPQPRFPPPAPQADTALVDSGAAQTSNDAGLDTGAIAGIGVGCLVGGLLLGFGVGRLSSNWAPIVKTSHGTVALRRDGPSTTAAALAASSTDDVKVDKV